MNKKETTGEKIFYSINYIVLALCACITIFPFIHVLATSFSSSRAIMSGEVSIWPVDYNTYAYFNLIRDGSLIRSLKNTVYITLGGTVLNMLATTMAAYPLSKSRLRGRKIFLSLIIFTMMFGGGLIPTFVLIKQLNLMNTYGALWLISLVSTWNMFIMKTFFEAMPSSLEESASLDGASDLAILLKIVLPLSIPVMATLTLFYAVGHWNSYFSVMIYITSSHKQSVMVRLMQMINSVDAHLLEASGEGVTAQQMITPEGIRAAAIVIATVPIMCVYPFLQKYFVKGVMIGSLKG